MKIWCALRNSQRGFKDLGLSPELEDRLSRITGHLVERLKPQAIYLFGSLARGKRARSGFDLDLLVFPGRRLSFRKRRLLREEVDEVAGIYPVDLLFESEVDVRFAERVKREGVLLYDAQG